MEFSCILHLMLKSLLMRILVLSLSLLISLRGCGQQQVPKSATKEDLYKGMLYSREDMEQLKKTADSLNLRFLQCVPNPVYYSLPQTQATAMTFVIEGKKVPFLEACLKQGISIPQLRKEFPGIKIKDSSHVILSYQTGYDEYEKKYITTLYSGNGKGFSHTYFDQPPTTGSWIYDTEDTDKEKEYTIKAWLTDKPFATVQLPAAYARMIQYADCMIDTTTVIMLNKGGVYGEENKPFQAMEGIVYRKTNKNVDPQYYTYLNENDIKYIHREYYQNDSIKLLLDRAVKEALEKGNGNGTLEKAATGIYSLDTILLMKRSRVVYGYCSQDDAPRMHARDIAVLASQAHQWPVFIRAHLDIMNDHFDRMSDGDYAEAGRKTYLRELELLDIPAQQLLLGTIFMTSNVPSSHYTGDLRRIGRAFTESAYAAGFEKQIKSMMKDKNLDPFNKCLFFLLYINYCYRLPLESDRNARINDLKATSASYPEFIRAGIKAFK